jgi:hypothetical protein
MRSGQAFWRPIACLLKMDLLSPDRKRALKDQFESLDPFQLHDRLEKSLRPILAKALEVN